ncbi:MAG: DUF839 domain-containing protein [Longispora sp.]|nr:DUF839 domain-containing protein [Longispora sp. (in: high G+C Gram-positive bacteria)]
MTFIPAHTFRKVHPLAPSLSRRSLLRSGIAGGLGIVIAGSTESISGPEAAQANLNPRTGYGELIPDPAGLLALPRGFKYTIVAESGVTRLESGEPTPGAPDGTGWFRGPHGTVLVNNHELAGSMTNPVPTLPGLTYDPGAPGGTTNIEVDRGGNRIRQYVSLAGTLVNCAGGVTPWKTWLTGEEYELRADGPFTQDHGYVFEVDPINIKANVGPVPLKFLGRFAHEAVAVDPKTFTIYETEDASGPNGLYYRWLPPQGFRGCKGALRDLALNQGINAGTLQAMSCFDAGRHVADLSEATEPGTRYTVRWITVPDRDARETSIRRQFGHDEVTHARKLEGAWWGNGGAYFVSSFARTDDGSLRAHDGQVWFYNPRTSTVTLKTIFGVNPDPGREGTFDGPDNITVSPYGGIILAEDGVGVSHLIGVTAHGTAFPMARNQLSDGEFTGPVFSGDARILFANFQHPGHVFAITGRWGKPDRSGTY